MQSMDCNHGRVKVRYFFLSIIIFCSIPYYNSNGIAEDSVLIIHFLKFGVN